VRRLALLLLASTLTACTLLPESEPPSLHLLPATPLAPAQSAPLEARLRVETPQASALLSGARILVMPEPNRLQAYAGARWSDRIPLLLRDRLVEGLRDRSRLQVQDDNSPLSADVALVSDLRAFHSVYPPTEAQGSPVAVIRLDASLVDESQRRLLAERRFEVREPSEGAAVAQVVEAFGRAADELARAIAEWSEEVMATR
jgi:cholesterol transport system auxiliary component